METRQEEHTALLQQRSDLPTDWQQYSRPKYNIVTPTKRSTHPPCITAAVQQITYTAVVEVERAVKPPWWVQKTKVRNTSNTQSNEHTRPSTYWPTNPSHLLTHRHNNPPTHQPTYPRCGTAIQQGTAAAADELIMIQTELATSIYRRESRLRAHG